MKASGSASLHDTTPGGSGDGKALEATLLEEDGLLAQTPDTQLLEALLDHREGLPGLGTHELEPEAPGAV
jgi:hypothetical protein